MLAASEHLAAFDAEQMRSWRERYAPGLPVDEEVPDEDDLPRGIRIFQLGREFRYNSDIAATERIRVLAVLDNVLGDTADPERHSVIAMFLRMALDLEMLQELWPSLGPRVRRVCFLLFSSWPAGAPGWMTVDADQLPPWNPALVARIRRDGRDAGAPGEPLVTDPFAVEQLADPEEVVTWAPPEAIAAWSDLAGKVHAELTRVGISATIDTRLFDRTAGLHIGLSIAQPPYGVTLEWRSPLQNSKKYNDDLLAQNRTELMAYSIETHAILLRAALDVLAAAGFHTMVYYYFPHDRGCEYRVLAPPENPIT
ncbi:hypothetical protein VSH64_21230 [Amycolatopsis rhabdoformis]|uniref:Uncharacterized protein n=1 Tax=Amycolatopsis rhabdoformis TaxID=1448059 RepID=A0ABZ1IJE5_9PSEU|nr:hypothetical protein [Amycolatopsis rhabdoformis]WSE34575.1 hypothetical protein VSH64_21230 [Amycolatopsis rhabdoformis]